MNSQVEHLSFETASYLVVPSNADLPAWHPEFHGQSIAVLDALIAAASNGLSMRADLPGLTSCICKLRRRGVVIDNSFSASDGSWCSTNGRYVLVDKVRRMECEKVFSESLMELS